MSPMLIVRAPSPGWTAVHLSPDANCVLASRPEREPGEKNGGVPAQSAGAEAEEAGDRNTLGHVCSSLLLSSARSTLLKNKRDKKTQTYEDHTKPDRRGKKEKKKEFLL